MAMQHGKYCTCTCSYNISPYMYRKGILLLWTVPGCMSALLSFTHSIYIHVAQIVLPWLLYTCEHLDGYRSFHIFSSGPTKKTLVDFWRMVWEQQVHVVVMTTKCVELGRHKCTQYWPDEGVVRYGNVTVTVVKLQQCEGYEMRSMKITCRVRRCVCVVESECTCFSLEKNGFIL